MAPYAAPQTGFGTECVHVGSISVGVGAQVSAAVLVRCRASVKLSTHQAVCQHGYHVFCAGSGRADILLLLLPLQTPHSAVSVASALHEMVCVVLPRSVDLEHVVTTRPSVARI